VLQKGKIGALDKQGRE